MLAFRWSSSCLVVRAATHLFLPFFFWLLAPLLFTFMVDDNAYGDNGGGPFPVRGPFKWQLKKSPTQI